MHLKKTLLAITTAAALIAPTAGGAAVTPLSSPGAALAAEASRT